LKGAGVLGESLKLYQEHTGAANSRGCAIQVQVEATWIARSLVGRTGRPCHCLHCWLTYTEPTRLHPILASQPRSINASPRRTWSEFRLPRRQQLQLACNEASSRRLGLRIAHISSPHPSSLPLSLSLSHSASAVIFTLQLSLHLCRHLGICRVSYAAAAAVYSVLFFNIAEHIAPGVNMQQVCWTTEL